VPLPGQEERWNRQKERWKQKAQEEKDGMRGFFQTIDPLFATLATQILKKGPTGNKAVQFWLTTAALSK